MPSGSQKHAFHNLQLGKKNGVGVYLIINVMKNIFPERVKNSRGD